MISRRIPYKTCTYQNTVHVLVVPEMRLPSSILIKFFRSLPDSSILFSLHRIYQKNIITLSPPGNTFSTFSLQNMLKITEAVQAICFDDISIRQGFITQAFPDRTCLLLRIGWIEYNHGYPIVLSSAMKAEHHAICEVLSALLKGS